MALKIIRNAPENESAPVKCGETFYGGMFAVLNDAGEVRVASPTVRATHIFHDCSDFVTAHQGGNQHVSLAPLGPAFQAILYSGTPQRGGESDSGSDGAPYEDESYTRHSEIYCSSDGKATMVAAGTAMPTNLSYADVHDWNSTTGRLTLNMHEGQRI